jgi:hypothetical protein
VLIEAPVLIGPVGVGKTTVSALLADHLGVPLVSLDAIRLGYYHEIGYDDEHAGRLREAGGFAALYRYWKPFEAHAVERVLAEHQAAVIDCGAGHAVQDDPLLFARIQRALAGRANVVLLLPSPDPAASIRILRERLGPFESGGVDFHAYFVQHPANRQLATLTVYTADNSPQQTCDEILRRMRRLGPGMTCGPRNRAHD